MTKRMINATEAAVVQGGLYKLRDNFYLNLQFSAF